MSKKLLYVLIIFMMILIYKINFKRLEYFSDSTPFLSLDKFIDVKKINKLNKYIESLDLANQKSVSLNTRGKEYSRKIVLTD